MHCTTTTDQQILESIYGMPLQTIRQRIDEPYMSVEDILYFSVDFHHDNDHGISVQCNKKIYMQLIGCDDEVVSPSLIQLPITSISIPWVAILQQMSLFTDCYKSWACLRLRHCRTIWYQPIEVLVFNDSSVSSKRQFAVILSLTKAQFVDVIPLTEIESNNSVATNHSVIAFDDAVHIMAHEDIAQTRIKIDKISIVHFVDE